MTDPHLLVSEIADWFAAHVYLPKLRDHVVLDNSIRDAVAKLDPQFGYADAFDQASGTYENLGLGEKPARAPRRNRCVCPGRGREGATFSAKCAVEPGARIIGGFCSCA